MEDVKSRPIPGGLFQVAHEKWSGGALLFGLFSKLCWCREGSRGAQSGFSERWTPLGATNRGGATLHPRYHSHIYSKYPLMSFNCILVGYTDPCGM